ncbi:hypothetical protein EJ03DRAFT_327172 [Teratosphaeria nubilosa]|uniref:Uncharacterized protein n=1 Tax=Teratosphaeria nubilosa TaxID=161662 RepID=A0A6G1LBG5_9PEZI|nr:hypothetical protein EJ03DRAFT_327172 [Teratosphaeria nubilosa]
MPLCKQRLRKKDFFLLSILPLFFFYIIRLAVISPSTQAVCTLTTNCLALLSSEQGVHNFDSQG